MKTKEKKTKTKTQSEEKIFMRQLKPVATILKKSLMRKTELLDAAKIEVNDKYLVFSFRRAPHKKSGWAVVGNYGASVPLPKTLLLLKSEARTGVYECSLFVENLIAGLKKYAGVDLCRKK